MCNSIMHTFCTVEETLAHFCLTKPNFMNTFLHCLQQKEITSFPIIQNLCNPALVMCDIDDMNIYYDISACDMI